MDTGDKVIRGLLWAVFILPQVDRKETALSQRGRVFFGGRRERREPCKETRKDRDVALGRKPITVNKSRIFGKMENARAWVSEL